MPLSADDIFAVHPKIRWAGLATKKGKVTFMQMREGLTSLSPESNDRATLEVRAQYIIETVEQECAWGGVLDHIAISFEKYAEIIIPLKTTYVAISVEKDLPPASYEAICKAIRELA